MFNYPNARHAGNGEIDAPRTRGQRWGSWLEDGLAKVLSTQRADGSYGFPNTCGFSLNYMTGLLNDVLIKIHGAYEPDPRAIPEPDPVWQGGRGRSMGGGQRPA